MNYAYHKLLMQYYIFAHTIWSNSEHHVSNRTDIGAFITCYTWIFGESLFRLLISWNSSFCYPVLLYMSYQVRKSDFSASLPTTKMSERQQGEREIEQLANDLVLPYSTEKWSRRRTRHSLFVSEMRNENTKRKTDYDFKNLFGFLTSVN